MKQLKFLDDTGNTHTAQIKVIREEDGSVYFYCSCGTDLRHAFPHFYQKDGVLYVAKKRDIKLGSGATCSK
jgi:hypothetical protein